MRFEWYLYWWRLKQCNSEYDCKAQSICGTATFCTSSSFSTVTYVLDPIRDRSQAHQLHANRRTASVQPSSLIIVAIVVFRRSKRQPLATDGHLLRQSSAPYLPTRVLQQRFIWTSYPDCIEFHRRYSVATSIALAALDELWNFQGNSGPYFHALYIERGRRN